MLFEYRNVYFDIDEKEVDELIAKSFFDHILDEAEGLINIDEIEIPEQNFAYIYIQKQNENPDDWDKTTDQFVQKLSKYGGYDVMYSDEDYGEDYDVILIDANSFVIWTLVN